MNSRDVPSAGTRGLKVQQDFLLILFSVGLNPQRLSFTFCFQCFIGVFYLFSVNSDAETTV